MMHNRFNAHYLKVWQVHQNLYQKWYKHKKNHASFPFITYDMGWFHIFMCIYVFFLAGHKIDCFECNSWNDPRYWVNFVSLKKKYFWRCGDPFNYTLNVEDMPTIKKCEGCCVKLVQKIGTPLYSVRRTCTDDLGMHDKYTFQFQPFQTIVNDL